MPAALRPRVILVLIAAALPAVIAVYALAVLNFETDRQAAGVRLRQDVELVMSRLDAVPLGAARLAATVAAATGWAAGIEAACGQRLAEVLPQYRGFDGAVLLRKGRTICAGGRRAAPDPAEVEKAYAALESSGSLLEAGLLAGPPRSGVFGAGRTAPGGLAALVFVDMTFLDKALASFANKDGRQGLAAIAAGGALLAGGEPRLIAAWEAGAPLARGGAGDIRRIEIEGRPWLAAAAKFSDIDAALIAARPESGELRDSLLQFYATLAGPALVIAAVCLGIWLGFNRLVLRWERRIRTAARAYARGDSTARVGELRGAPREFAQLAADFNLLADRVTQRTLDREKEIDQKNSYIRELHHRVKNNLQMIVSLLALQRRGLPPAQQRIVLFPETRVNAIAAAFQLGYRRNDIGAVEVKELIFEVCQRLRSDTASPDALRIDVAGVEVTVNLDDAISLAMVLAELLADRLASRPAEAGPILCRAEVAADSLRVALDDPAPPGTRASLPARLLATYATQLRASISEATPGKIILAMPLTPLREG